MAEVIERYSTTIDIYSNRRETPKLSTAYLCFKIILLIANLVFMIFACVLMGVGSYALNTQANGLAGQTLPSGLIAMGVFMLFLAALGAISAWKESVVGLGLYLALLLLISIILFSIGVAVSVQRAKAGEYIAEAWMRAPGDVKNSIQLELGCCGLKYFNDSSYWPCPPQASVPGSPSCYAPLVSAFETAYKHAGGTGIAFSVFMGLGVCFVVCLIQGIQRKSHQESAAKAGAQGGATDDGSGTNTAGDLVNLSDIDAAASMFDRAEPHEYEAPPPVQQQRSTRQVRR